MISSLIAWEWLPKILKLLIKIKELDWKPIASHLLLWGLMKMSGWIFVAKEQQGKRWKIIKTPSKLALHFLSFRNWDLTSPSSNFNRIWITSKKSNLLFSMSEREEMETKILSWELKSSNPTRKTKATLKRKASKNLLQDAPIPMQSITQKACATFATISSVGPSLQQIVLTLTF